MFFSINLYSNTNIILTKEEKDFLNKNEPLRLHNEVNWPPYNYYENNEAKGFSIDYMNLIANKLNVKVEYRFKFASTNSFFDSFNSLTKRVMNFNFQTITISNNIYFRLRWKFATFALANVCRVSN